jgi:hypothetical protein
MRVSTTLTLLTSAAWSVAAAPAIESLGTAAGRRLIKTSPADPGQWVTEEQKIKDYKSKGIGFVDVTDITDAQVLAALSAPDTQVNPFSAQAVSYPSSVGHQAEANPLVMKASTTNPKTWLKALTE